MTSLPTFVRSLTRVYWGEKWHKCLPIVVLSLVCASGIIGISAWNDRRHWQLDLQIG
jgi:hypothetical protein